MSVSSFGFQMIIYVSAYKMREYKQCLMLETEVIFLCRIQIMSSLCFSPLPHSSLFSVLQSMLVVELQVDELFQKT